jgi:hypothetical protein
VTQPTDFQGVFPATHHVARGWSSGFSLAKIEKVKGLSKELYMLFPKSA